MKIIGRRAAIRYFHTFPPSRSFLRAPTMGFHSSFTATTLQTLKLAAFPTSSSSRLIFRPPTKNPSLNFLHFRFRNQRPPCPLLVRAFSSPAVQADPPTATAGEEKGNFIFLIHVIVVDILIDYSNLLCEKMGVWFRYCCVLEIELVAKPQWKASIDFKWIRDNKDLVAANIENRKSGANLELVLQLYDKMLNLQKVRF